MGRNTKDFAGFDRLKDMNESTALARRLALQLGGELDTLLGAEVNSSAPAVEISANRGLEIRQIAGLTAGAAMPLSDGAFQFGQSSAQQRGLREGQPEDVGFILTVKGDEAWVESGDAEVTLNGEAIDRPTKVGDAVIEVGSARFAVLAPRRALRRGGADRTNIEQPELPIAVPDFTEITNKPASRGRPSLLGAFRNDAAPDPVGEHLATLVREHRDHALARRRAAHPHPEEIVYQARDSRSHAWERRNNHPHFAQVAIAYGDLPWRPQFDRPDRIPTTATQAFQHLLIAPSVPITADLQRGPLGIIGDRASALAVARHVIVALSTLSPPNDLTVAVLADDDRATDWTWADHLPHNTPENDTAFPVLIVDGLHHVANPALDGALLGAGNFGAVLLGSNINELPPICSCVLLIDDGGTATVIDNRDGTTTMRTTPLGLTPDLATVAVNSLNSLAFAAS